MREKKMAKKPFYGIKIGNSSLGLRTNLFRNSWKELKKMKPNKKIKYNRR